MTSGLRAGWMAAPNSSMGRFGEPPGLGLRPWTSRVPLWRLRVAGGVDGGADLVDGAFRRASGPWTPSVHLLLSHLFHAGFVGAPRPLGWDREGREILTLLEGQTVGLARPWPEWVHSDLA